MRKTAVRETSFWSLNDTGTKSPDFVVRFPCLPVSFLHWDSWWQESGFVLGGFIQSLEGHFLKFCWNFFNFSHVLYSSSWLWNIVYEYLFALSCIIYLDFRVCEYFLTYKKYRKKLSQHQTASDVFFLYNSNNPPRMKYICNLWSFP